MKYALIAAGQGSRLVSEGVKVPKPLVQVGGTPLLSRLFRIFLDNDAESICIIINEEMSEVRCFLEQQQRQLPIPLNVIVKSTPDSFHSFYELMPYLQGEGKFCLTTVDPIFREAEFADYIRTFRADESAVPDGALSCTPARTRSPAGAMSRQRIICGLRDMPVRLMTACVIYREEFIV